jgi:hypothetical protein
MSTMPENEIPTNERERRLSWADSELLKKGQERRFKITFVTADLSSCVTRRRTVINVFHFFLQRQLE